MKYSIVRSEWGVWLSQWKWDWFGTLTFRFSITCHDAHKLWKKWLHLLEGAVRGRIHYARATEFQKFRGDVVHFHFLMIGTPKGYEILWQSTWFKMGGLAKIMPYDPKLGAAHYLTKYVGTEIGDIILSRDIEKLLKENKYDDKNNIDENLE